MAFASPTTGTPSGGFIDGITPVPASWLNYIANNMANAVDGIAGGYYQLVAGDLRISSDTREVKFNAPAASDPISLRGFVTIGLSDDVNYVVGAGTLTVSSPATFSSTVTLTVGATVTNTTTNAPGITTTGNGTGPGIDATGGASNASGGLFNGGTGNGIGVEAYGTGSAFGGGFQGGPTGYGVLAQAGGGNQPGLKAQGDGTGAAVDCLHGGVKFSGTQPAASADPGANVLHGTHITHAWARIHTDGAGGVTVQDGVNVSGAVVSATNIEITFAGGFSASNYAPQATNLTSHSRLCAIDDVSLTTTTCQIVIYDSTTGGVIDPTTTAVKVSFAANGRR